MLERAGRLDILVNNAGINIRKNIEEMPVESFDAMLAVNVKGPFLGIKHSLPIMRAAGGGVILNMSSICGLVGHRYTNETYTTTKGALTLLTKSVAVRYAKDNIRCNSVHPSTVETAFVQAMLKDPERRAERLGEVPLGRLASATDVANALVYLAERRGLVHQRRRVSRGRGPHSRLALWQMGRISRSARRVCGGPR